MANGSSFGNILDTALKQIKEMASSDTVIGEPILLDNGIRAIPVSRVSVGFTGGGAEFGSEKGKYGGGMGGGVKIIPVAFLVSGPDGVKLLQLVSGKDSPADNIIRTAPELIDRIIGLVKKDKAAESEPFTAKHPDPEKV